MQLYNIELSPAAAAVLQDYVDRCCMDNGVDCSLRLLDSYDSTLELLETQPFIGCARLRYIPDKYRVVNFWPHLWFVFQVKENEHCVKIEYIIDDRQNYGTFIK